MTSSKLNTLTAWLEIIRLGWIMGYQEYKLANAGSKLGRYWPTIGMAIRIFFIGMIFSILFGSSTENYFPWLASGLVVWGFVSTTFQGAANSYISSKTLMMSLPLDMRSFICKAVVREALSLIQNLPLILVVVIIAQPGIGWQIVAFVPAALVTVMFLFGSGMALGPLLARYRDIGPLMNSIFGVMFFLLPIMWRPEDLGNQLARTVVGFNPLYHYLQLMRLPLVGETPTLVNWCLATLGGMAVFFLGLWIHRRTIDKVFYWA